MFGSLEEDLPLKHRPNKKEPWAELHYMEAKDINDFIQFTNTLTNVPSLNTYSQPTLFRGQASSDWRLEPKIYRLLKKFPKHVALGIEFDSIKYFAQHAQRYLSPQLIPEATDIAEWLALMQHYGAPTRMLDWTTSFNVALYFATSGEPSDAPGAVWFFSVEPLYKWMRRFKGPSEAEIKEIIGNRAKFVDFGSHRAEPKIDTYDRKVKSDRMFAQQTIFTYCNQLFSEHADLIGNALMPSSGENIVFFPLCKIVICSEVKRKIREYLHKLNISAATLFPSADGIGREICEIINLRYDVFQREVSSE